MLLASVPAIGDCEPCSPSKEVILWAGQDTEVGDVTVWHDNENIMVLFTIDAAGWRITESQVHVATSLAGIPQTKPDKNGNTSPKIGKFNYSDPDESTSTSHKYIIDMDDIEGFVLGSTCLWIATHAVVKKGCGDETQEETAWGEGEDFGKNWAMYFVWKPCPKVLIMPTGMVSVKATQASGWAGMDSTLSGYFNTYLSAGGNSYVPIGNYIGWCVDSVYTIGSSTQSAYLYSSLDPFLGTHFPAGDDRWDQEWDKINYMLNHKEKTATTNYDAGSFQNAIWSYTNGLSIVGDADAQALVADAEANGVGYLPGSGDWVAIIVYIPHLTTKIQLTIIEVDP
jgi:hypothetical protein